MAATKTKPETNGTRRGGRVSLPLLGPAFVAAVAYVDPGNFATNTTAGARYGTLLIWVVVAANLMAMLVQWLSSHLGIATGMGLAEVCRERWPRRVNIGLWLQAEVVAMATDLAEIVGAAVALNLLFGISALPAGVIAALVAMALLQLERRGYRRFELAIIGLLAVILIGYLYNAIRAGGDPGSIASGLIPHLEGKGSLVLAVGILGATVMPHVIYLHSSLVAKRPDGRSPERIKARLRANLTDVVAALGIAGLVNVAMLWVASTLLHGLPGPPIDTLKGAYTAFGSVAGQGTATAFALALLASGFASASVGTYAGQVIMEGFIGMRIPLLLRRAITITPALVILALGINPTGALVISQVVLSFGIPFALMPLVRFTADRDLMGDLAVKRGISALACVVAALIVCLNVALLVALASS